MLLALIAAPALIIDVPEQRQFGDWVVACDNVRRCEAVALPRDDHPGEQVTLSVLRKPMAGAQPVIDFSAAFGEDLPRGGWRIDGRRFALSGVPLLRALAGARSAEWVLPTGKVHAELPVIGAAAALRWIDDRQGRAGTMTALVAQGASPASKVPTPPPLPRLLEVAISRKPPKRLNQGEMEKVRLSGGCNPDRSEADFHRLDANHSVGIIGCFMGAYQGTSLILLIEESGRWSPARIEWPKHFGIDTEDRWASASLTSADYDDVTSLLVSFAKGRGLGDCGYSASWAWDGRAFRLSSLAGMDQCRGSRAWLSMWQTANDPAP